MGNATDLLRTNEMNDNQFLKTFLEAIPLGILLIRSDGCIQSTNPNFVNISGYPYHHLIGMTVDQLFSFDGSLFQLVQRLMTIAEKAELCAAKIRTSGDVQKAVQLSAGEYNTDLERMILLCVQSIDDRQPTCLG